MANCDLAAEPRHRTNDVMDLVTADHRHIEACLRTLGRSLPGPQRTCLVTELNALLIIHLEVEEATLHPMMRDLMGSSQEEESDVEHELIRTILAQATQLVDAPGFRCAIEMLSAGVRHHVCDEEHIVLPTLLGLLTLRERSALDTAMRDAHRDPDRSLRERHRSSELPAANAFNTGH
jgi:hypothetical protein